MIGWGPSKKHHQLITIELTNTKSTLTMLTLVYQLVIVVLAWLKYGHHMDNISTPSVDDDHQSTYHHTHHYNDTYHYTYQYNDYLDHPNGDSQYLWGDSCLLFIVGVMVDMMVSIVVDLDVIMGQLTFLLKHGHSEVYYQSYIVHGNQIIIYWSGMVTTNGHQPRHHIRQHDYQNKYVTS